VFPLEVTLWTPDGSQLLAHNRDTVRSTAVSGVGVILIVLAIVSLAVWWIRDLHHGRRARRLVPVPTGENEDTETVSLMSPPSSPRLIPGTDPVSEK
jgi:hypothetical protein